MTTAGHPPGDFCWNELGTRGAAAAKRFYAQLFGWGMQDLPMGPGFTYTLIQIDGKDVGGLYDLQGAQFEGVPPHWLTYIAVEDVDQSAQQGASLGGTVLQPPMDVPNVGRMAFLKDPQGAAFAIFKGGQHHGAARLGSVPGTFCWNELSTADTAAARTFYTRLFGWTTKVDAGPMPYTEFMNGGVPIGGMIQIQPAWGPVPPNWMGYVLVEDCDAIVRKAGSLGGSAIRPCMDIPKVGRFAVLSDPQGAVIAVIKLDNPL